MLLARFPRPDPQVVRHRLTRIFRIAAGSAHRAVPAAAPAGPAPSGMLPSAPTQLHASRSDTSPVPAPALGGTPSAAGAPPAPPDDAPVTAGKAPTTPGNAPAPPGKAPTAPGDAARAPDGSRIAARSRIASAASDSTIDPRSAAGELDGSTPHPDAAEAGSTEGLAAASRTEVWHPSERLTGRLAAAFGVDRARIDPGRPGTRALAVVAAVVVLVAAAIAWWSQPEPEPVAPRVAAPTVRPSGTATGVVVAVAGKVRKPGLVTLPAGARVADAIKAAGGVLPGTDVGYLNLARKVTDGELIVVGASAPPAGAPGGATGAAPPGDPAGKVNLNQATLQQLDTLPGVGPVLAQRILDYRDEHGGFRSVDELRQVDGIGPARYEQLKDLVTV